MQTTVDIPDTQVQALNALSKARNQTPAEFIAEVLTNALNQHPAVEPEPLSWHNMDGVEYQRKIRAEWDREWDR